MPVSTPQIGTWIKCSPQGNIYMLYMQRNGLKETSLLVKLAGFVAPETCVSEHDVTTLLAVT
jgi:hypothetical protein